MLISSLREVIAAQASEIEDLKNKLKNLPVQERRVSCIYVELPINLIRIEDRGTAGERIKSGYRTFSALGETERYGEGARRSSRTLGRDEHEA